MKPNVPDKITDGLISESHYKRLRMERFSHFKQSVPTKLKWQCGLLIILVFALPLYALFPSTVAQYLPATDPATASPKVILLGAVGGSIEVVSMSILAATAMYRLRHEPLSERQARSVLNVEDFASMIGLITGTIAIGITMAYFGMGITGGETVGRYIDTMNGVNPFAASGIGITVVDVCVGAFGAFVVFLWVSEYLRFRLVTERLEQLTGSAD